MTKSKIVRCPSCGHRIMDAYEKTESFVEVVPPKSEMKPDYRIKCGKCGKVVSVTKIL